MVACSCIIFIASFTEDNQSVHKILAWDRHIDMMIPYKTKKADKKIWTSGSSFFLAKYTKWKYPAMPCRHQGAQ
jgi:hypothetical protein